ncbi:YqcI/YcgG family protein [bacterium]|nr:YqcI/YcgG family protein [bacterium]
MEHTQHISPDSIKHMVALPDFPCMMAKTVFSHNHAHRIACADMADLSTPAIADTLQRIYTALEAIKGETRGYHSIILEFATPAIRCEHQFETLLWAYLQALHDMDSKTYQWDSTVESDPHSAGYSFSLHEEAFYIIGMHPLASRKARRTDKPTLVFNLHSQFEKLRQMGTYTKVRDKIRARDVAYSGSTNPMLEDFGASSEAAQYSGRHFDKETWTCPFKPNR